MIIPPRCFTCGKPLADKWIPFILIVNDKKKDSNEDLKENELDVKFINTNSYINNNFSQYFKDKYYYISLMKLVNNDLHTF